MTALVGALALVRKMRIGRALILTLTTMMRTLKLSLAVVVLFAAAHAAKAVSDTPRKDFPHSNAGTCMMYHEHPAPIRGDVDMKAITALCLRNGVAL